MSGVEREEKPTDRKFCPGGLNAGKEGRGGARRKESRISHYYVIDQEERVRVDGVCEIIQV